MKRATPLVIAVLACCIAGCVVKIGSDDASTSINLDGISIEGRATRRIEAPLDLQPGERLLVSTSFGKVTVEVFESLPPRVDARLSLQGETEADAKGALEGYRIVTRRTDAGLRLAVEGRPLVYQRDGTTTTLSASVAVSVIVPPGTPLEIVAGSGDVTIKGPVGDLSAKSSFGDLEVTGAAGTIQLAAGSGDITVTARPGARVDAPWHLHSKFGDVELRLPAACPCSILASATFGSIAVDVPGTGEVRSSEGSATYSGDLGGGGETVAIDAGSGDIRIGRSE